MPHTKIPHPNLLILHLHSRPLFLPPDPKNQRPDSEYDNTTECQPSKVLWLTPDHGGSPMAQLEEGGEGLLCASEGGALRGWDLDLFEFLHHEDVDPVADEREREKGEEDELDKEVMRG